MKYKILNKGTLSEETDWLEGNSVDMLEMCGYSYNNLVLLDSNRLLNIKQVLSLGSDINDFGTYIRDALLANNLDFIKSLVNYFDYRNTPLVSIEDKLSILKEPLFEYLKVYKGKENTHIIHYMMVLVLSFVR